MPVPLRRKYGFWVVHQPLFCQFLSIYGPQITTPIADQFARVLLTEYRYGSILHLQLPVATPGFTEGPFLVQEYHTHLLPLQHPYPHLYQQYAPDTRRHLRRAKAANWTVETSTDLTPLLNLFKAHHAGTIPGGVAEWAYDGLNNVVQALQKHGMVTLRYASRDGKPEAGVLFAHTGNRVVYLFNAASAVGRKHHARTILIDQWIQETSGRRVYVFDFESSEKRSIARFYKKFGTVPSGYLVLRWNQMPKLFRGILALKNWLLRL
ncbi:GNAT family N-acetyltransferase [Rudanella paleaurantiibacter]|uniref:GNAT family N-acetyltransferase n=2 Tax=Rudanella paleaurantiibacter TaxID=2614655 RepID=A0A7J5TZK7_9BACT|nr:GNAT family N-acetyltransferase [Rudanella paleaurantiibacter]